MNLMMMMMTVALNIWKCNSMFTCRHLRLNVIRRFIISVSTQIYKKKFTDLDFGFYEIYCDLSLALRMK